MYGYIARDKDGELHLFIGRPTRFVNFWADDCGGEIDVPEGMFLEVKWEHEPIKVEIKIEVMQ